MRAPDWLLRAIRPRRGADALGRRGERAAAAALRRAGYRILARRLRVEDAEVDLLALERDTVVVVEVKTSRGGLPGAPARRVDAAKRRRLAGARRALARDPRLAARPWRLDVVAVTVEGRRARCEILKDFGPLARGVRDR